MNRNPTIDILLATYNGGRYLSEQIQSLLDQTYTRWRLIIRDDGSTDDTLSVIHLFKERYPEKIKHIEDGEVNLGACRNFARLLEHADAEYTMFCDQDDVWLPWKIALTLEKMNELVAKYGNDVPLLVYTDMKVVDENLSVISKSFWKNQAFNPKIGKSLGRFLVSNVATGCTVMINKKLRELAVPMPPEAMMHDWWVGLISVALGKNDYVPEPTMLYRQHVSNAVGAKWDASLNAIIEKVSDFGNLKRVNAAHLLKTQEQAKAFAARYRHLLSTGQFAKVTAYAELDSKNFIGKRIAIVRYGFWWAGFLRSFTMFVII
jgi:glycosyltransferase involved in cell wall biosynthesis